MPKKNQQRRNHPLISYLIGFVFITLTAVVFVGIVHHLTVSHHGPQLLKPLLDWQRERNRSDILTEARRQVEQKAHERFHHEIEYEKLPENMRPVCYICHSDFPHSKQPEIRSLLNMHTQFIACETCHIEEGRSASVAYRWYHPKNKEPTGPFLGTHYDPESGEWGRVEDVTSKIAPFRMENRILQPLIRTQDAPLAKDFMKVRERLTPEERDGVKSRFHEHIKPIGYACSTCHATDGVLDLAALGFSADRAKKLRDLTLKSVLTNQEAIHLPDLYRKDAR